MTFEEALRIYDLILENGPLGTRLLYDYKFKEPPFALIDTAEGQAALRELYCGDVDVALAQGIPIVINAATFRSGRNFLRAQGFTEAADIRRIFVVLMRVPCVNLWVI